MSARRSAILGFVLVIVVVVVMLVIQAQREAATFAQSFAATAAWERGLTEDAALATLQAERALTTSP